MTDLKPENVMILGKKNESMDDIDVELIDYGISKSLRKLSSDHKFLRAKGHFGTKGNYLFCIYYYYMF